MSPNGISSGFDRIFVLSSSESSDSESILQEDLKTNDNDFNKQWEAIERTLYQEPGPQVTDSELLKECKLWRETFPHFRVKGTKVDLKQPDNEPEENDKGLQTLENHINLKKIEEKRETIKSKVVGMLVDRLITKYGSDKGSAKSEFANSKGGIQITEIDENSVEPFLNNPPKSAKRNSETSTPNTTDKESYFERGKPGNEPTHQGYKLQSHKPKQVLTEQQKDKSFYNEWEREFKNAKELTKTFDRFNLQKTDEFRFRRTEKLKQRRTPPSNSVRDAAKPFEMTTKISKKYEGLVEKIFDRKSNELEAMRHCRTSASHTEMKKMHDSLQKLRIGSSIEDYLKKNKSQTINKFDNNWLRRSEIDILDREDFSAKTPPNPRKNSNFSTDNLSEINARFLEELKKEMSLSLNYKRPPMRTGVIDGISLRRPKPFPATGGKSSSCVDLQKKNKETKGKKLKSRIEPVKNESNLKKGVRHNRLNAKGNKSNGNQSQILPPIDTGIICTELTGRPKIGTKVPPKRY